MRPVALGRKIWLHIGSPQAGPKVAAILSVVESCRMLKLPVRLTPAAWLARHSWTHAKETYGVGNFATATAHPFCRRFTTTGSGAASN